MATTEPAASAAAADASAANGASAAAAAVEKHPLQHKWVLWYDPPKSKAQSGKNWDQNLRAVAEFETVEDFWALFNSLQEPSQLQSGSSYNLFKAGIEPKWEDKANQNGGQWRLQLANRKELLDEYWLTTVMTAIGEGWSAPQADDIAGIVVNLRRGGDRLSIWTKSATNAELQDGIGQHWHNTGIGGRRIEYLTFKDQKAGNRHTKPRYSIG